MTSQFENFFHVISREAAEKTIQIHLAPLGKETVSLSNALDRISAESLTAPESLPPFARSTVDGFAVKSQDTFGASEGFPVTLEVAGVISIGTLPEASLKRGKAMAIPTGGALPEGADAVVMVEHTESPDPAFVEIYRPVSPFENVVRAGEDIEKGRPVLERGRKIRPQELGLLAALGITRVSVTRKPVVGIISSGNEVVSPERVPGPGQIRDINRFTLQGLIARSGGEARFIGLTPDDEATLKDACERGLASCDLLLLSGGSSVGTRDLTLKVLEEFGGFELLAHGIAVSPGKPTIIARIGGKMIFGLPGHPVSTWVIALLFVTRAIQTLLGGRENYALAWDTAVVDGNIPSAQGREDFIRAKVTGVGRAATAFPIFSKSGVISSLAAANALIRIPLNSEGVYKGEEVAILRLP